MAENETQGTTGSGEEEGNLTIVAVPEDKAQAVLDYVASLLSDESDVSGHMLSGRLAGSMSAGMLAAKQRTRTNCVQSTTGIGTDFTCSDTDSIETNPV
jgi:hypothetical protein